ncbi:MAG: tRNA lysidine(34) synthetase TilS, partial [Alphaproteobacteria bacterium]|nr:tRNA lysidine(34) synthetase TilS [Alphaproteobacteria bacterium]
MADRDHAAPVTGREFADALQALSPGLAIAVAVSGGADSMALLHLTTRWLEQTGQRGRLLALTVDHGLRAASAAEAEQIGGWCREIDVSHKILRWQGVKPVSDIQSAARRARYELMTNACKELGIPSLLLGHQLEDQAETFLLRLGRGSGVDGLSAMAPERDWNGVRILRPLLGFSRLRLQATLKMQQTPWIEDPSNHDPRFARVRMRDRLQDMAAAGLGPARLAQTAGRMRRVRNALEDVTWRLMREVVQWEPCGFACLSLPPLMAAP